MQHWRVEPIGAVHITAPSAQSARREPADPNSALAMSLPATSKSRTLVKPNTANDVAFPGCCDVFKSDSPIAPVGDR